MDCRLTPFQFQCENALSELLEFHGRNLAEREIVTEGEPYIHGRVDGANIEIWIYRDEAEYKTRRKRRNYEAAVFGSAAEAINSFVKDLAKELK